MGARLDRLDAGQLVQLEQAGVWLTRFCGSGGCFGPPKGWCVPPLEARKKGEFCRILRDIGFVFTLTSKPRSFKSIFSLRFLGYLLFLKLAGDQ